MFPHDKSYAQIYYAIGRPSLIQRLCQCKPRVLLALSFQVYQMIISDVNSFSMGKKEEKRRQVLKSSGR